MAACAACGKTTAFGRNIRHQHTGRWERKAPKTNRAFRPNLHVHRKIVDGVMRRVRLCTRCLRTDLRKS